MLKELRDIWRYAQYRSHATPRPVTEDEYDSWFAAAMEQDEPPKHLNRNQLLAALRLRNPVRMRRLRKDYAWMQRQLKKLGANPEDARWLL